MQRNYYCFERKKREKKKNYLCKDKLRKIIAVVIDIIVVNKIIDFFKSVHYKSKKPN